MRIGRLSILGTGLLGGSIGLACREILTSTHIVAYNHNPRGIQRAIERGAIHQGFESPAAAVVDADLIILCTPVGVFGEILGKIAGSLKAGAIVTDVGSTKRSVVALAEATLPNSAHFVGSHPMAGGEKQGIDHARADLLAGARCIVTPSATTDPEAVNFVEKFWQILKMQTIRLTPEVHDQRVADISHLPHAIAAAMVRIQTPETLELAARGFADTTRIAAGDCGLWRDILLDNRDNIKTGLRRLQDELSILGEQLDAGNETALTAWLSQAAELRKEFGHRRADRVSGE
jgi:prephenate dehydrogenase